MFGRHTFFGGGERHPGQHPMQQAIHHAMHHAMHGHPLHGGGWGMGGGWDDGAGGERGFGGMGGGRGMGGGGRGGRGRERMFEQGGLRLIVLELLAERPRHGYEVIKAIEDLAAGQYSPSPGVIYPTLTLLEELGQAEVTSQEGGKKQYTITDAGREVLAAQADTLARIHQRLGAAHEMAQGRNQPQLMRAMRNFHAALHLRLHGGAMDEETLRKVVDAIDAAAVAIERA